jgi:cytoskeletal protein CcmA (bactofilin family)
MRRPTNIPRTLAMAALIALLLLALTATFSVAADFLGGKVRTGDSVTVPAGETVDHDLYVFAGTVTVDGKVNGDLVAAGGTIRISGLVTGDVLVAGGTVQLAGDVTGDARVAAGQLTITGNVAEDVAAGVGTLDVGGDVGGDLLFGAGNATVSGPIAGSIQGSAGAYSRTSTVGGTEQVVLNRAQPAPAPVSYPVIDAIRQFVVVFIFGALGLWLLPRAVAAAEMALRRRALASLGIGVVAIIGYVVTVVILFLAMVLLAILFAILTLGALVAIDLVGGIVAFLVLTLGFGLAASFFADVLVGLTIGRLVLPAIGLRSGSDRWQDLGVLAVGAALVVIVTSLPVVGWFAKLLVVLFGLGAIAIATWLGWRGRSGTPAAQAPPAAPDLPPAAPAAG